MACGRTRAAGACNPVLAGGAGEPRNRLRLSRRDLDAKLVSASVSRSAPAALAILLGRRRDLSPRDYQRIRWVIWGCLIGLPAYLLAELSQETSLLDGLLGEGALPEEVSGPPLPDQRRSLPVRRGGGAPADRDQRMDPAAPGDGPRALVQRAGPLPSPADRNDRRMDPYAGLGLGARGLGSRVFARARARVRDRARGPACSTANLSAPSGVSPPWERPSSTPTASPRSSASWRRSRCVR